MEPVVALRAFWAAMCELEKRAWRERRAAGQTEFDTAPLAAQEAAIIAKYCTIKRRVYSEPFVYGTPPMYDPDAEQLLEVIEESDQRVVIHTQRRAMFKEQRRYVMLRRSDRWLLDSWQWLNGGKWVRGIV